MSEFKDKVEKYKQNIVEAGFKPDDGYNPDLGSGLGDIPTISVEDSGGQESHQESSQDHESHQEMDQQFKQKKPGRKTVEGLKKRIDQITFEKNVREAQTQELLARVQEQERRLSDQQAMLEQNEQYKNAYYENNLQTREKAIINELKVAKEDGDVDKEIELSKQLAKVTADQSTYGLYKSQLRNQQIPDPYQNQYNNQQNIYPQPTYGNEVHSPNSHEESYSEAYDTWIENNPWADPDSRNYSPRLREEAVQLANELDEMLKYNGNGEYIGTPAYYTSIDNLMSQRYGVQNKPQQEQELRPKETQSYSVAPVSRNGSSMADQYMTNHPNNTRRSMSLSEDEYKIARNLQIKLPNGSYATGDEAIRRYADAKRLQNPQGSHKLTIE